VQPMTGPWHTPYTMNAIPQAQLADTIWRLSSVSNQGAAGDAALQPHAIRCGTAHRCSPSDVQQSSLLKPGPSAVPT
jgi:hypothetical protein